LNAPRGAALETRCGRPEDLVRVGSGGDRLRGDVPFAAERVLLRRTLSQGTSSGPDDRTRLTGVVLLDFAEHQRLDAVALIGSPQEIRHKGSRQNIGCMRQQNH